MNEFYKLVTELKIVAKLTGGEWNVFTPMEPASKIKYPCLVISFIIENRIFAHFSKKKFHIIDGDDPVETFNQAKEFLICQSQMKN